jgi:death-on-curing family protein
VPTKTIFEHFLDWLDAIKELEPDEENRIYYPKKEQIISLHDYLIKNFRYEGESITAGVQSDAILDFTGLKYYEQIKKNKWEDLIYRGAHIFNSFLEGHPFYDGNKRTGFVTLWLFLTINNFYVKFEYFDFNEHIEKFKKWASPNSDNNIYEISLWIKENETLLQQIKRCLLNFLIKIEKLVFR